MGCVICFGFYSLIRNNVENILYRHIKEEEKYFIGGGLVISILLADQQFMGFIWSFYYSRVGSNSFSGQISILCGFQIDQGRKSYSYIIFSLIRKKSSIGPYKLIQCFKFSSGTCLVSFKCVIAFQVKLFRNPSVIAREPWCACQGFSFLCLC